MPIEQETKLLVGPDFDLPDLDDLVDGVVVASDEVIEQRAVYFDTPDLRLTRHQASLRYRSDDGWTVKLPAATDESRLVRAEHGFSGDSDSPPTAAVDLLTAWIRTAPLTAVARVTTHRHGFALTDETGQPLAEVDDDRVETFAQNGAETSFREIEIEFDEHVPPRLAKRLTKGVRKAGPTERSLVPKVARAVGVEHTRRFEPERDATKKTATARRFVQRVLEDSLDRLVAHDPVIRIGDDPEGVHQARVATRRIRADLRTFGPLFVDEWAEPLRDELRWLGRLLGRVRDADVLCELLQSRTLELAEADQANGQEVVERLTTQRESARAELLTAMRSVRYKALLDALVEASEHPQLRADVELERAAACVTPLAFRQVRRLRRAIRRLDDEPSDAALHMVRRRAKHARYAFEAVSGITKGASSLAQRAEELQGVLGDYQDRVVARTWLVEVGRDHPALALTAGELAGLVRAEQREIRADAKRLLHRARKRLR